MRTLMGFLVAVLVPTALHAADPLAVVATTADLAAEIGRAHV